MSFIGDVIKILGAADLDKVLEVIREVKSLIEMINALGEKLGIN